MQKYSVLFVLLLTCPAIVEGKVTDSLRCERNEKVEFKIIAYNRPKPLQTLLHSLNNAYIDRNDIKLQFFIDAPRPSHLRDDNMRIKETVNIAKAFYWNHGQVEVHRASEWQGVRRQWLNVWKFPTRNTTALILEDDMILSPLFFIALTHAICTYSNASGVSLQRAALTQSLSRAESNMLQISHKDHPIFLYRGIGPWGYSPHADTWSSFLDWYKRNNCNNDLTGGSLPTVCSPNVDMERTRYSLWYNQAKALNKTHSLWTPIFAKYVELKNIHTLYYNLPNNRTFAANSREKGEHHSGKHGIDFEIAVNISELTTTNKKAVKFDWNGLVERTNRTNIIEASKFSRILKGNAFGSFTGYGSAEVEGSSSSFFKQAHEQAPVSVGSFHREFYGNKVASVTPGQLTIFSFGIFSFFTMIISHAIVCCLIKHLSNLNYTFLSLFISTTELALLLAAAYSGEKLMPTAPKINLPDMFITTCIIFVIIGFVGMRKIESDAPMNRKQTNEWRGWMQIAFVMYHFTHYNEAYIPIRAFVAAYVWQTGWGNTMYACKKDNPYTFTRFFSMIWRINAFAILLSMTTETPWILYYVVALHSLHFIMVFLYGFFACMGVKETSKLKMFLKLALFATLIASIWNPTVYNATIQKVFQKEFGELFANEFRYRTTMDRFSSLPGIFVGFYWESILSVFCLGSNNATVYARNTKRTAVICFSVTLFLGSIYSFVTLMHNPQEYRKVHPYVGLFWVPAYLIIRNCCKTFRMHVLAPFEFLGKYSLEMYLLQFHLILSNKAQRLLVIVPNFPYTNLCILFIIYIFVAMRIHKIIHHIREVFFSVSHYIQFGFSVMFFTTLLVNYLTSDSTVSVQISVATSAGLILSLIVLVMWFSMNHKESKVSPYEQVNQQADELENCSEAKSEKMLYSYFTVVLLCSILIPIGMYNVHSMWPNISDMDGNIKKNSNHTELNKKHTELNSNHTKFSFDILKARSNIHNMRTMLEEYYGGRKVLVNSVYLKASSDGLYEEGVEFIARKMARAIVHGDSFVVGAIGSSVTAGHDNCNYDSYERQLQRLMDPLWKYVGVKFEVRNAGQGGVCGDDFHNSPFCVRQLVGDDVDIVHYSWTYFEAGQGNLKAWRENLLRWSLLMKHSPAVHVINVGADSNEKCGNAFGSNDFYKKYAKYGANAICFQAGLKAGSNYSGNHWGEIGDTLHNTTRYGENSNISEIRRDSLGVVFRNWHPGPLGFQVLSDALAYYYSDAMLKALDMITKGYNFPKEAVPISQSELPDAYECNSYTCDIKEPPGCITFELPAYGNPQITVVPPDEDPQTEIKDGDGEWDYWKAGPNPLIPASEKKYPYCQHLDHCGALVTHTQSFGWLTFQLPPSMERGTIVICCYRSNCVTETFFDTQAEFIFDGKKMDPSKFDIWPNGKCLRLQKNFGKSVNSIYGHLYLSVRFNKNPKSENDGISHVIAF